MKIFFDTEFTGLRKDTSLISIGLVSHDNKTFYAELLDYDLEQCDDWIFENVIRNLKFKEPAEGEKPYYVATRAYDNIMTGLPLTYSYSVNLQGDTQLVREELAQWLAQFNKVEFVSDVYQYDMVLLNHLLGGYGSSSHICPACIDLNQDIMQVYNLSLQQAFDFNREDLLEDILRIVPSDYFKALPKEEKAKHNALWDAIVIKCIYEFLHDTDYVRCSDCGKWVLVDELELGMCDTCEYLNEDLDTLDILKDEEEIN